MDLSFANYMEFLAVFARMTGMIFFNPFLSRKSIPVIAKVGLALLLSLLFLGILPADTVVAADHVLIFVWVCVKELFIGFLVGFIIQIFISVLLVAGELADLQLGVGMASVYDPQSNLSMPLIGNVLNVFYVMLFFISGGHLTFFKIIAFSFDILPLGNVVINPECGQYVVLLFANILVLAVKLALPIIAIEVVSEIGIGVMMRSVPQINVFVVGLQIKLLLGLVLLLLVFPSIFDFFDSLTDAMFISIKNGLQLSV